MRVQEDTLPLHDFDTAFLFTSIVLAHRTLSQFTDIKPPLSSEAQVRCSAWGQSSINVLAGDYFTFFWNPITSPISLLAIFNVLLCILALCVTSALVHWLGLITLDTPQYGAWRKCSWAKWEYITHVFCFCFCLLVKWRKTTTVTPNHHCDFLWPDWKLWLRMWSRICFHKIHIS